MYMAGLFKEEKKKELKRNYMAHEINVELPRMELGNTDMKVFIHSNGEKLGEIRMSKGTIDYFPAHKQYSMSLTWAEFDNMMSKRWEDSDL